MLSLRKKLIAVIILLMAVTVSPVTVWAHTAPWADFFVQALLDFDKEPFYYEYYALHDFDGDGIPELLLGKKASEFTPELVFYAVWKYDLAAAAAGQPRFVHIGAIEPCNYLVKDKYSNALIALWKDSSLQTDGTAYFNYYISDNRIERNTVMTKLTYGQSPLLVYNSMWIESMYTRNDIAINAATYTEAEKNILGTYKELIVHDWRGFNEITVYIAVHSWKPHSIALKPRTYASSFTYTRSWQSPIEKLIKDKHGSANTYIEETWVTSLLPLYGQKKYERFALHDIDGDNAPELLLGVRTYDYSAYDTERWWDNTAHFSYDVYKWWNNEMRFIGSFDCYGKYLTVVTGSHDIFTFDPVSNEFYDMSAKRISISDNMLTTTTVLASKLNAKGKIAYYRPNDSSKSAKPAAIDHSKFRKELHDYVSGYAEIRTFDIEYVPFDVVLIMYVRTNGFTID